MKYRLLDETQINLAYLLALALFFLIVINAEALVDDFQAVIVSSNDTFYNVTVTVCTTNTTVCADTWNQTFISVSGRNSTVLYLQGGGGLNTTYNQTYWVNVWLDDVVHTTQTQAFIGRGIVPYAVEANNSDFLDGQDGSYYLDYNPFWIDQGGYITSNSSSNSGNVNVTGNLSISEYGDLFVNGTGLSTTLDPAGADKVGVNTTTLVEMGGSTNVQEALEYHDALLAGVDTNSTWKGPVIDKDLATPPADPPTVARYVVGSGAADWWDTGWGHREKRTVEAELIPAGKGDMSANTQMIYVIINGTSKIFERAQDDGDDIRFVNTAGDTEFTSHRQMWNNTHSGQEWAVYNVMIPEVITAGSDYSFYIYYNNSLATGGVSVGAIFSDYLHFYEMNQSDARPTDLSPNGNNGFQIIGSPVLGNNQSGRGVDFVDTGNDAWDLQCSGCWWESGWTESGDLSKSMRTHFSHFKTNSDLTTNYQVVFAEGGSVNGVMLYVGEPDNMATAFWWSESQGWAGGNFSFDVTVNTEYWVAMSYLCDGANCVNPGNYTLWVGNRTEYWMAGTDETPQEMNAHSGQGGIGYTGINTKEFPGTLPASAGHYFGSEQWEMSTKNRNISENEFALWWGSQVGNFTIGAEETQGGASGAWAGKETWITIFNSTGDDTWQFDGPPVEGWTCWERDDNQIITFNGEYWTAGTIKMMHNNLDGIQGGDVLNRWHMTEGEHTEATQYASLLQNGLMTISHVSQLDAASASGVKFLITNDSATITNLDNTFLVKGKISTGIWGSVGGVANELLLETPWTYNGSNMGFHDGIFNVTNSIYGKSVFQNNIRVHDLTGAIGHTNLTDVDQSLLKAATPQFAGLSILGTIAGVDLNILNNVAITQNLTVGDALTVTGNINTTENLFINTGNIYFNGDAHVLVEHTDDDKAMIIKTNGGTLKLQKLAAGDPADNDDVEIIMGPTYNSGVMRLITGNDDPVQIRRAENRDGILHVCQGDCETNRLLVEHNVITSVGYPLTISSGADNITLNPADSVIIVDHVFVEDKNITADWFLGKVNATDIQNFELTSTDIDDICSTNNKILERIGGTWQCADDDTGGGGSLPAWESVVYTTSNLSLNNGNVNMSNHTLIQGELYGITQVILYQDVAASAQQNIIGNKLLTATEFQTGFADANQPDVPRVLNYTYTCVGAPGQTRTIDLTINGTDADGKFIQHTDTIVSAVDSGEQYGGTELAFGFVDSVEWVWGAGAAPIVDFSLGSGGKLGLPNYPYCATDDLVKLKENTRHLSGKTIIIAYGTVDLWASISAGDDFTFWANNCHDSLV